MILIILDSMRCVMVNKHGIIILLLYSCTMYIKIYSIVECFKISIIKIFKHEDVFLCLHERIINNFALTRKLHMEQFDFVCILWEGMRWCVYYEVINVNRVIWWVCLRIKFGSFKFRNVYLKKLTVVMTEVENIMSSRTKSFI